MIESDEATAKRLAAEGTLEVSDSDPTTLIEDALMNGLLTPSQRAWAERQTLAALREYLGANR